MKGPAYALMQLAAGIAGSYLATERFNQATAEGPQEGRTDQPGDPATSDPEVGDTSGVPALDPEHTEFGRFKRTEGLPAELGGISTPAGSS